MAKNQYQLAQNKFKAKSHSELILNPFFVLKLFFGVALRPNLGHDRGHSVAAGPQAQTHTAARAHAPRHGAHRQSNLPIEKKPKSTRVLGLKMNQTFKKAKDLCKAMYYSFPRADISKIILGTLTRLACKSLTTIHETVSRNKEIISLYQNNKTRAHT
jgi:hypothetical protein